MSEFFKVIKESEIKWLILSNTQTLIMTDRKYTIFLTDREQKQVIGL